MWSIPISTDPTHTSGVLDTCVIVDAAAGHIDQAQLPDDQWVTTVTLGELSTGPLVARRPEDAAMRQSLLLETLVTYAGSMLPYDEPAARAFGRVIADVTRSGRRALPRTADLMIAATAISQGLPLYTINVADFAGIGRLQLVPVVRRDPQGR